MNELMQIVIDKLGIKVGERFKVDLDNGEVGDYYFNEEYELVDEDGYRCLHIFVDLLYSKYKIINYHLNPKEQNDIILLIVMDMFLGKVGLIVNWITTFSMLTTVLKPKKKSPKKIKRE